jgi:hypothetical protein
VEQHPFDLSFVHSQIADYPDFSDDEPATQRKVKAINSEDEELSAIASDSSFNEELRKNEEPEESEQDNNNY